MILTSQRFVNKIVLASLLALLVVTNNCCAVFGQQITLPDERTHNWSGTLVEESLVFINSFRQQNSSLNDDDIQIIDLVTSQLENDLGQAKFVEIDERSLERFLNTKFLIEFPSNPLEDHDASDEVHEANYAKRQQRREEFKSEWKRAELLKSGFQTIGDQQSIVDSRLKFVEERILDPDGFLKSYYIFLLGRHGPTGLFKNQTFQRQFEIASNTATTIVAEISLNKQRVDLNRKMLSSYFDLFTENQLNKLSSRLFIDKRYFSEFADLATPKQMENIFNGKTAFVNFLGYQSTRDTFSSRLAKIVELCRATNFGDEVERNSVINQINEIQRLISRSPPGMLDVSPTEVFAKSLIEDPKTRQLPVLTSSLERLVETSSEYKLATETAWTWPGFRDLKVRFHVREFDSSDQLPLEHFKSGFAGHADRRGIPVLNQVNVHSLKITLAHVGLPLRGDQEKELKLFENELDRKINKAESIEELVSINNEFVLGLDRILLPVQCPFVFQSFFLRYGIHIFFQRPDVKRDFGISGNQSDQMEEVAKQITISISNEVISLCESEIADMLSKLPDKNQRLIESFFDVPKNELAANWVRETGVERISAKLALGDCEIYSPRKRFPSFTGF